MKKKIQLTKGIPLLKLCLYAGIMGAVLLMHPMHSSAATLADSHAIADVTEKNGIATGEDGTLYYYKNDIINTSYSGYIEDKDVWYKIISGKVDTSYTGIGTVETGRVYFVNGVQNFTYTGLAGDDAGWYYYKDGKPDYYYTGLVQNEAGNWYIKNGMLDFNYSGYQYVDHVCYIIKGGHVNTDYTGMGKADGDNWYYFVKGVQDIDYTGMAMNEAGWWYYRDGKIVWDYTGLATNEAGTWYYENGGIHFNYTNFVKQNNVWYAVIDSKVAEDFNAIGTADTDNYCYFTKGVEDFTHTGMEMNEAGWWYYRDGKIDWNYTGLAKNEAGTWYFNNGGIDFNYTNFVKQDNVWYAIIKSKVAEDFNAMGTVDTDNYCYFTKGVEDFTYTGMASNEAGWWYYIDGKIDWNHTGLAKNEAGTWYFNNGGIDFKYTNFVKQDNVWYAIIKSKVAEDFNAMGTADTDNYCYFTRGVEDFNYTGMASNEAGWWYYRGGKIDWNYTGLAKNEAGTWYYNNGGIDFKYTNFVKENNVWYAIINSKVAEDFNAMGTVDTDNFCYFTRGVEDFTYTGMASNEAGWWYYINGKLDWNYTGLGNNASGWWYYHNGNIDFNYCGLTPVGNDWWRIRYGKVETTYTGMASNEAGWWYVVNGRIDFNYTGLGYNAAGIWYYHNGTMDFHYNGTVNVNGVTYNVVNSYIGAIDDFRICVPYDFPYNTVSCWGDSMTQGVGAGSANIGGKDYSGGHYPDILSGFTHYATNNYGIGGETSDQIMNRANGYYQNGNHNKDILLLEIGSNGGWNNDYNTLIEQYKTIIRNSGSCYYIIIGDTDDPGTSIGDLNQTEYNEDGSYVGFRETAWEAALSAAFGDHFFNTRLYMLQNGLSDAGLTATDQDNALIAQGKISKQLRYDWTHFNSYGYYSKALGIFKKGMQLGYWG